MNLTQALILRNDALQKAEFTATATLLKSAALEKAALIGKVSNADEQKLAVAAQADLATLNRQIEAARKACKEPVLNFGRQIDEQARLFSQEVKEEELRLSKAIANFQAEELARIRAAEAAENERLTKLERERQAELAKAQDHKEMDKVNEVFNERAKVEAVPPVPIARVQGQVVKEDWNVEVTDIWLLAKSHPTCVHIEPRLLEIKSLLNAGVKVAGVRATKEVKAGVQSKRQTTINV